MKPSHKKWVLLGACALLIGLASAFFWKVTAPSQAPAVETKSQPAPENPEHELKALGMDLQKKPGHIPVLMRMAQIEREQGKLEDAAAHLREAVNSEPANPDPHLELGRILYERGDVSGSIAEAQKVLDINPKQVDALYNLGAIYANSGNLQRARSYWSKAVAADPAAESSRKAKDGLAKLGGG